MLGHQWHQTTHRITVYYTWHFQVKRCVTGHGVPRLHQHSISWCSRITATATPISRSSTDLWHHQMESRDSPVVPTPPAVHWAEKTFQAGNTGFSLSTWSGSQLHLCWSAACGRHMSLKSLEVNVDHRLFVPRTRCDNCWQSTPSL